ncbi:uncharacterized protein A4U43_C04F12860 [Asparagus officinalis]|uniref:Uncharacterized protein n=1 Tax=Asparagus officinalis TaxID=4686 RepID=A0A5P1F287_ASPOF|nr:uncharacterized protein A4U43_C04F12860 [Asparagus officinalis]
MNPNPRFFGSRRLITRRKKRTLPGRLVARRAPEKGENVLGLGSRNVADEGRQDRGHTPRRALLTSRPPLGRPALPMRHRRRAADVTRVSAVRRLSDPSDESIDSGTVLSIDLTAIVPIHVAIYRLRIKRVSKIH